MQQRKKLLITGSEGRIGQQLVHGLPSERYDILGFDIVNGQDAARYPELRDAAKGSFAIIHTAFNLEAEKSTTGYNGDPNNFAMGRFALAAAVENNVQHCIMASSVNAARTATDGNWSYRSTKLDLERLATQHAIKSPDTRFTSVRYGRVKAEDTAPEGPLRADQSWLSASDHVALIEAILESDLRREHTIVYGVSNRAEPPYPTDNPFGWQPQSWFGEMPSPAN